MLHPELTDILLRPIRPERVKTRRGGGDKQLSYVEGYDVRAALNRFFGFAGWSNETQVEVVDITKNEGSSNYFVTAKAHTRLHIHYVYGDTEGDPFGVARYAAQARYEDVAAATASNPNLGEAMDQAIKTAATDSLKRCAANLGDQFGLSLYNDGSTRPVVRVVVGHKTAEQRAAEAEGDGSDDKDGSATPAVQDEQAVRAVVESLGGEVINDDPSADALPDDADVSVVRDDQDSGAFR